MAKLDRILSFFPSSYAATERHKLLYEVLYQLALHLEEADTHLFRIQRAHRLQLAEQAQDIVRLAAMLNLTLFHFEDLMRNPPLLSLPIELRTDLNIGGSVPQPLQMVLCERGLVTDDDAAISVQKPGRQWLLRTGKLSFILKLEPELANVYVEDEKQPKITMPAELCQDLKEDCSIPDEFAKRLRDRNISMSNNASISVQIPNRRWLLAENGKRYIICKEEDRLNLYELYERNLTLMRERIQRIANLHLQGLGTPWAILQSTAIFLNATIVPEHTGDPLIKQLDSDGFSHKATIEFTHKLGKPRERLYLHENPFQRQKVELSERWTPALWTINNKSTGVSPVRIVVQGIDDRTILPSVYCPDTEVGIMFNGIVPDGSMLVIDEVTGATLEGKPVDDRLIYFEGGAYEHARMNRSGCVQEQGDDSIPFDGNLESITVDSFRDYKPGVSAPIGQSQWHFKVSEGVYDGGLYDYAVYTTPSLPIGFYDRDFSFGESVFDYPASAIVGMAWDERIPCAFKLLLPSTLSQSHQSLASNTNVDNIESYSSTTTENQNHVSRISSIIPRFKSAGIRAYVDTAQDAWILGESVIRCRAAIDGKGIYFRSTCLRNMKADMLIEKTRTFNREPSMEVS